MAAHTIDGGNSERLRSTLYLESLSKNANEFQRDMKRYSVNYSSIEK